MQHMLLPNHLGFTGLCEVKPIYSHKAVVKESVVFITRCKARSQACVHAKSLQMCLTLSDPMDCSLPGSSVHRYPRQEYWSGFLCPPPGDLPVPGIKPGSPALQAASLSLSHLGSPSCSGT